MKNITPISIWKNGESTQASVLTAMIVGDNLHSLCTFYYELKTVDGEVLANGNVGMSGTEYENWDGSNDAAYTYIANQLNLTIQQ